MQVATTIYAPIEERLARVERSLRTMPEIRSSFLAKLLSHVFDTVGKRIRPALTLLSSSFHEHDPRVTEIMATAVEALHIATLVHDDTVDSSSVRRGRATLNSLWGRNAAVLAGDYIFAKSATYVCDTGDIRVIRRFSETIMELSTGELQEMSEAYNGAQTMEQYLERIYNKTASLFTTACQSGAILSGAPDEQVAALREYGYNLGMAFQIMDDILDFEASEEDVGKPVGNDLSHGTITLPAIIALRRQPEDNPILTLFDNPEDASCLSLAVEFILGSAAIEESYAVASDYCRAARRQLDGIPDTPARASLEELADYVMAMRA